MRVVSISDTHGKHEEVQVPDGDLLVHAGDCTGYGHAGDLKDFIKWFAAQPHEHKVLIAGNHDWIFQREQTRAREIIYAIDPKIEYLNCSSAMIAGEFFVWGAPWTPEFCDWAFNLPRGEALAKVWSLIPRGTDILVTHGPPRGILDYAPFDDLHVGCDDLLLAVQKIQPRLHIFGHIHHDGGMLVDSTYTKFINASVVNEAYEVVNSPRVYEIKRD